MEKVLTRIRELGGDEDDLEKAQRFLDTDEMCEQYLDLLKDGIEDTIDICANIGAVVMKNS